MKEAIELLEKIIERKFQRFLPNDAEDEIRQMQEAADQALAILKKPCETCGDTGQVGEEESLYGRSMGFKACPDCQPVAISQAKPVTARPEVAEKIERELI